MKSSRKSTLSSLDEPGPALMNLVRRYGTRLLVLVLFLVMASYFLGGSSDGPRKQTFITLEIPPPVQSASTTSQATPATNQSAPPIPDDQD
ncbi:MAG: hypothetical protein HW380_1176 [Magnetococcales bacterium]|nr:hypothetical protein [Magnetococcales bacterium]